MSSEISKIVSLIIELRPRIKSANVFIRFSTILNSCPSIILEKTLIKIITEQTTVEIPCNKFLIMAGSLSNLKINGNFLIFRFSTENIAEDTGSFRRELLLNPSENLPSCINNLLISKNTDYTIYCINCENPLSNTVRFRRVLPLPSDCSNPNEWFCHNDNSQIADLSPKIDDIFYAHSHVHLNVANIHFVKSSGEILVCKYCLSWIGVKLDKKTAKVWFNTAKFVSNLKTVTSSSLLDVFRLIKDVLNNVSSNCRLIISCQINSKKTNTLLLWVLEKKLQILFKETNQVTYYYVSKVLFKFVNSNDPVLHQWNNHSTINNTVVSKPMMNELLKHLYKSNKFFPDELSKINDFYMSYLCLYDNSL